MKESQSHRVRVGAAAELLTAWSSNLGLVTAPKQSKARQKAEHARQQTAAIKGDFFGCWLAVPAARLRLVHGARVVCIFHPQRPKELQF